MLPPFLKKTVHAHPKLSNVILAHDKPLVMGSGVQVKVPQLMISQFNGTSAPKGSYSVTTGVNDCNVNSSRYSLRTALCESNSYQAKSEQNVRQDLIPRVRHGEAAL